MRAGVLALTFCLCLSATAQAAPSVKKSIWGPITVDGKSQFPIYADLGVGIFQKSLNWNDTAPTRPAHPRDPSDPAYRWPSDIDLAISEGKKYGIRVLIQVLYAPSWANGGRTPQWSPRRPRDYADFMVAAARRYPAVRYWMVWGEPSRQVNFQPMPRHRRTGPEAYSRILDAAYGALKGVRRSNVVIGGNTFTSGDIRPLQFIQRMRLPNGRRPRLDMYGHNPFTTRSPALRRRYVGYGFADYSDLDTLAGWLDTYLGRRRGRPIKIFISEFTVPTDHANGLFNFHVSRRTQADWLAAAMRIARRWPRIYTLGWFTLYDEAPGTGSGGPGRETNWGLLDWRGVPKPAYRAYQKG